jgi:hypothetical protein
MFVRAQNRFASRTTMSWVALAAAALLFGGQLASAPHNHLGGSRATQGDSQQALRADVECAVCVLGHHPSPQPVPLSALAVRHAEAPAPVVVAALRIDPLFLSSAPTRAPPRTV